jgi:hypothetical protein
MPRLSRYGWRAAEPARRPVLFVNPRSGGGRAARASLVERARERGIDALVLGPHHDLAALVDEAVADGADALGMAGGDGSLAVVAAAARAEGLPFVCATTLRSISVSIDMTSSARWMRSATTESSGRSMWRR